MFDAPGISGPFEKRQKALAEILAQHRPAWAKVLEQVRCTGVEALKAELTRVEALGGEGLMLRQPGSLYEAGRSSTLLKVKTFHDAEGRVVEHLPGKGRHAGRLGAVVVELPDGQTFSVGTGFSDAQREHPPAIGSLITYRYQEMTERRRAAFSVVCEAARDAAPPALAAAVASLSRSKRALSRHGAGCYGCETLLRACGGNFREVLGDLHARQRCHRPLRANRRRRSDADQDLR